MVLELDPDDAKLEIPWADPGKPSRKYLDLKKFPENIGRLKVCRSHPAMAGLLRILNAPDSAFGTAKCDVWTTRHLEEDEKLDFNLPCKVGSYVDLIFANARLNSSRSPMFRLAKILEHRLRRCRVQAQAEMDVRRCLFHPRGRWGYYATIYVHGYGQNLEEAESEWSRAIKNLGAAFSSMDSEFLARHRGQAFSQALLR